MVKIEETSERWKLICGDAEESLRGLEDESVDCCVTSPPYYALRDYGTGRWVGGDENCDHSAAKISTRFERTMTEKSLKQTTSIGTDVKRYKEICPVCGAVRIDEQIGLEQTPEEYIEKLVGVFREVRRVLKPSGTCWINIGDSYWGSGSRGFDFTNTFTEKSKIQQDSKGTINLSNLPALKGNFGDYKNKDLIGIPWMLAFALRKDGWYLRQDIIWAKPNCMPESITDRCTKSHEYIFLLSKQPRYYFDAESIKTDAMPETAGRYKYSFFDGEVGGGKDRPGGAINTPGVKEYDGKANKRDVWFVTASGGYTDEEGSHYATYSPKLIEPCIIAGCPTGGTVIDPFNGTGTTGEVALRCCRNYIGIDLSEKYIGMAERRLSRLTDQVDLFSELGI